MPPRGTAAKRAAKSKPTTEAYQLGVAKLESSGLTAADAELLGIEYVDSALFCHARFQALPALKLPYFDPYKPGHLLSCRPHWPSFYRLRYLKEPNDFSKQTKQKPTRYVQEPDTGVCAYFPQNLPEAYGSWAALLADWTQPLIITEGELKAAKATKEGFPTIGLGGVHNFRSTKGGLPFLEELERIVWARRNVYMIYDSDFRKNENVVHAINLLAEELMDRGALPHYVGLPDVYDEESGKKTGLDDFLVERPAAELVDLLQSAQQLTLSKALWEMNKTVVYVMDPGMVIVKSTGQKLAPSAFKDHAFSKATCHEYVYNADGTPKLKKVPAAPSWIKWEFREEAEKLTYAPGKEQMTEVEGRRCYNTWQGWGCEPEKGDVTPWLKLVEHLFTGAEKESRTHFERWCAFPIQYPGTKMFTSYVVHGVVHGTGKSLIGTTLSKIYGRNYAKINQKDLERDYNDWAENKQFIMGEEITGSNKRTEADALKDLITQKEMRINGKYVPIYTVPDCINYLFTSNHPDAFFLEDDDRRFNIHEVIVGALPEEFYMEYILWLDTGGAEALFHYLLNLDLGDFNPSAPAFKSAAKERMIMDSKSDLGAWVHQLLTQPDDVLRIGEMKMPGDLFTNKQLLELYDPLGRTKVSAQGLGNALKKAGARQVCDGKPVRVGDGQDRYYIVRNREKWLTASPTEAAKHLKTLAVPDQKQAKY